MVWAKTGRYNFVCATFFLPDGRSWSSWGPSEHTALFADLEKRGVIGIVGREMSKETPTKPARAHYQCYFEAEKNLQTKQWNKLFKGASFRRADGSAVDNTTYCSKEEGRGHGEVHWIGGNKAIIVDKMRNKGGEGQGARTDWAGFVEAVRTDRGGGSSDKEMYLKEPGLMVRFPHAAGNIRSAFAPRKRGAPLTHVMTGGTGTGKSHQADADGANFVIWEKGALQGYDPSNPVTAIDEFDWREFPQSLLLRMTDKWQCPANIKCATAQFVPQVLYILSNDDFDEWYVGPGYNPVKKDALKRKIKASGGEWTFCEVVREEGSDLPLYFPLLPRGIPTSRSPSPTLSSRSLYSLEGEMSNGGDCPECGSAKLPANQEGRCMCGEDFDSDYQDMQQLQ